jgi:hypothetical protein
MVVHDLFKAAMCDLKAVYIPPIGKLGTNNATNLPLLIINSHKTTYVK